MDLSRLQSLLAEPGPYVTLHAEVGRTTEDAADQLEARWTTARHELERADVAADVLEDLGARLRENLHEHGPARRTLVATSSQVVLDEVQLGHSHWPEVTDVGDLPDVAAWVATEDRAVPFVLVVADRTGADVELYRAAARPPSAERTVTGDTFHITKVQVGGWSHRRFQETAENAWQANAREVADEVRSLASNGAVDRVFVAGEVRARSEVVRALGEHDPARLGEAVEIEAGGRAEGASEEALWQEVDERLTEAEHAADAAVVARLEEAVGRGEGAAVGLDAVLEALAKSQVDRLVLDLPALGDTEVDPARLEGVGLPEPAASASSLPADRALLAAGALTGAAVTVVSSALTKDEPVHALLRWAETPPDA